MKRRSIDQLTRYGRTGEKSGVCYGYWCGRLQVRAVSLGAIPTGPGIGAQGPKATVQGLFAGR